MTNMLRTGNSMVSSLSKYKYIQYTRSMQMEQAWFQINMSYKT